MKEKNVFPFWQTDNETIKLEIAIKSFHFLSNVQLWAARGAAVGAVEPQHGAECSKRTTQRHQPEHAGQGVSSVPGNSSNCTRTPKPVFQSHSVDCCYPSTNMKAL